MAEPFDNATSLTGPATAGQAVTLGGSPADHSFSQATRALYIGTAGTVVVQMKEGASTVAFKCTAGQILPVRALAIIDSGTDAADIVGLF